MLFRRKNKRDKRAKVNGELVVHIMHGYDVLETSEGDRCFGCYIPSKKEIYIAGDMPRDQIFGTFAHEYIHYIQDIEGKGFNEDEAELMGDLTKFAREDFMDRIIKQIAVELSDSEDFKKDTTVLLNVYNWMQSRKDSLLML